MFPLQLITEKRYYTQSAIKKQTNKIVTGNTSKNRIGLKIRDRDVTLPDMERFVLRTIRCLYIWLNRRPLNRGSSLLHLYWPSWFLAHRCTCSPRTMYTCGL